MNPASRGSRPVGPMRAWNAADAYLTAEWLQWTKCEPSVRFVRASGQRQAQ